MIKSVYWVLRIAAYAACLGGVVLHLNQQPYGIPLVGLGFICFFASYGIRIWLHFKPKRIAAAEPEAEAETESAGE